MIATNSAKAGDLAELVEREIEVNSLRWAIIFADILSPALLDGEGAINGEASALIAGCVEDVPPDKVARMRLVIADFHILALVLPETRTCRLYTPGAAQETFLLNLSADMQLQEHVDAVRQHPPTLTTIEELTAQYALVDLASSALSVRAPNRTVLMDTVKRQVCTLASLENTYRPPLVERVQNWFLDVIARDELLLHQVLRFVAVLPSLRYDRSRREVVRALRENVRLLAARTDTNAPAREDSIATPSIWSTGRCARRTHRPPSCAGNGHRSRRGGHGCALHRP